MRRLLIVGAGGFGREALAWLEHVPDVNRDWTIAGFLDAGDAAKLEAPMGGRYSIMGDPASWRPAPDELFVCAIGDPATRLRVCRTLREAGAKFLTLVHPTAVVGLGTVMGEGCMLCPGAVVTSNARLGDFVVVNVHASVGHDAVIGHGCTLSGHADVTGRASLGEGVFLGSHATILPGAVVGDYAVVGGGSVVLKRVRPHATVMGVPAKQVAGFTRRQDTSE